MYRWGLSSFYISISLSYICKRCFIIDKQIARHLFNTFTTLLPLGVLANRKIFILVNVSLVQNLFQFYIHHTNRGSQFNNDMQNRKIYRQKEERWQYRRIFIKYEVASIGKYHIPLSRLFNLSNCINIMSEGFNDFFLTHCAIGHKMIFIRYSSTHIF